MLINLRNDGEGFVNYMIIKYKNYCAETDWNYNKGVNKDQKFYLIFITVLASALVIFLTFSLFDLGESFLFGQQVNI